MAFNPGSEQEERERREGAERIARNGAAVRVVAVLTAEQFACIEAARLLSPASPLGCALAQIVDGVTG